MEAWVFIVILAMLAVGIGAGFAIGRSTNSAQRRSEALESEISELREHMSDYKQQVGQHFAQTADVVNAMTANYRALYDHLSKGAQDLCGEQFSSAMLDSSAMRFIEHHGDEATGAADQQPTASGLAEGSAAAAAAAASPAPEAEAGASTEEVAAAEAPEPAPGPSHIADAMEKSVHEAHAGEAAQGEGAGDDEESKQAVPPAPESGADGEGREEPPHSAAEQAASGNGELAGGMEGAQPEGREQSAIHVSLKEGVRGDTAEPASPQAAGGDEEEKALDDTAAAHAPADGKGARADSTTLH